MIATFASAWIFASTLVVSGPVTVDGGDSRSMPLLLCTQGIPGKALSRTISFDGSFQLTATTGGGPLLVALPCHSAGFSGGPWTVSSNSTAEVHAIRLTGRTSPISLAECAEVLAQSAATCALNLPSRDIVPSQIILNCRIALDGRSGLEVSQSFRDAEKVSENQGRVWLAKIEQDVRRATTKLPNYRQLDPEAALRDIAQGTDPASGMLSLSFDAPEFASGWCPELVRPVFSEAIGVQGSFPALVQFQVSDLSEPDAPLSPPLLFRRESGVSAADLQAWTSSSPTARLYLFRLAVALLARDKETKQRAQALLARYRPRLRINI